MFNKKSFLVLTALVVLGVLRVPTAKAKELQCYTVASLQGTYAIVGTYGSHIAIVLALRDFDGNGNLTGTFTINEPSPGSSTGGRTIVTGTQVGTYTVNCDGTGVITRVLTASNGVKATQMDDFVITGATARDSQLIATKLADAPRVSSAIVPGGVLLARAFTRLPDRGTQCYSVASLQGSYAVVGTYGSNVAIALALRHFDGKGNLMGTFTVNGPTPGSTTGARTITTGTQVGTYTVNCDGTGVFTRTVTASNGITTTQMDDFVITQATVKDGQLIATALEDAQRTPSVIVSGGIFLTRSYTRLPDPEDD